jgi:hypothetical protein
VVSFKEHRSAKTALFAQVLQEAEGTNSEIKFVSATFQLVETPELKINIQNSWNKIW